MLNKYKGHRVCIFGGLGNQMFMYAFYKYLKSNSNLDVKASYEAYFPNWGALATGQELSYIDDIFNTDKVGWRFNFHNKIIRILYRLKFKILVKLGIVYREKDEFLFDKEVVNITVPRTFWGYCNTSEYACFMRKDLLKEFTIKKPLSAINQKNLKLIENESCPVSLHVRRGDYLLADMYNILDENYYKKAWDIIIKENPDARPIIFSMDLEWGKENLSFLPNPIIISCKNVPMHEDIILMSKCTHNIVANSSFSWWGAFLNDYDDKIVIAPKRYFKEGYKSPETFFLDEWRRV